MEPTPESLFETHLAGQAEGDFEAALAAEIAAFEALLEKYPDHAKELTRLRDAGKSESPGFSGPLVGDLRAAEGVTIGDFRLVRRLGRGGMGEVWEAEQVSLSRRVALKLLFPEGMTEKGLDFFAREARAGARLNHPGIIAVLGAGEDGGTRWIAMELVEGGCTLASFLEDARSETELPEGYYASMAEIIAKVAEAVEAAHQAGVIHRDLKPLNILIAEGDVPKVADFGLARLVDENSLSQTGDFAGTYYYMSPEQVAARRMGIDHRTDVFSLGVLMYEMLTLVRPFEGDTTHQIAHKILTVDPPDPRTLRSRVPAELAVICAKAMEKDPDRRYAAMAGLAADLRRHLANEPILARPPSPLARSNKWVRRNPTKSAAGAVAAVAFVTISSLAWQLRQQGQELKETNEELGAQTDQARDNAKLATDRADQLVLTNEELLVERQASEDAREEATRERDLAEQRAEELAQVSDFQAMQLSGVDAEAMGLTIRAMVLERARVAGERAGREQEVLDEEQAELEKLLAGADFTGLALGVLDKEVFERALKELESFDNQPLVQARLLQVVGDTLRTLGLLERAMKPQEQSLEIRRRVLGDEHPDTLVSIKNLARLFRVQGKYAEAEPLLREALEEFRRTLGDEHPDALISISNLGDLFRAQGKYDEAESLLREALEVSRRTLGDEHPSTLTSINNLGSLFRVQGKYDEAEPLRREGLEAYRRTLGDEHPQTLIAINNLGLLFRLQGKYDDAELLYRECLEAGRRTLGDEHPDTLTSINNLGSLLKLQGKKDDAELLYRECLEARRRTLGNEHPDTLISTNNLGALLQRQGKYDEAELLLREALEARRHTLGEEHPKTLASINNLGILFQGQGKYDEAEPLYREALEVRRRMLGDEHPSTLTSINNLGSLFQDQGKYDEAERLYREALEGFRRTLGDEHPGKTLALINNLGKLFQAQGKYDDAELFLREALEGFRRVLGDEHPNTRKTKQHLDAVLSKLNEAQTPPTEDSDR